MPPRKKIASPAGKNLFRLDDIPEAAIITDASHSILAANKALLELLGYASEEIVGWPLEKIFPQLPRGLSRLFFGEERQIEFETKARMRNGKRATMDFFATPIIRRGKVTAVLYLGRDIRVKSLIEAEIRKARNYFQAIVENSPYGICVTDRQRNVMMANRAVTEITGFSPSDLVGKPVLELYPPGEKAQKFEIKPGAAQPVRQLRFRRKDGGEVPVLVTYSLVPEPGGRGEFIIESFSDQSDRRRVDQLKNEFVFVAAHELRNPVTAIRLLLDIIFEDKRLAVDPIMRGYLAKIQEANERLLHLVDDLLEVSRTEAGKLQIQVNPQNIVASINGLLAEMRPTAVSKGVMFQYEPPPSMPYVLADAVKLKEILTNLMANAIKYNVAGGSIRLNHESRGNELITSVADTGIGISEEDKKRIFQKFWRSEDLAVRAQPGTGLGLFIVKELVERMGGRVWAESKRGEGSTFFFSLPIAR